MPRVLVVEDDEHVGRSVRAVLERAGHEVTVAVDGASGVDLASTWSPDLVVLDLHLPDAHGLEVLTRLRSFITAPVLVVSGDHDEGGTRAALAAGADDYLVKPYAVGDLRARVDGLLAGTATPTDPSTSAPTTLSVHDIGNTLAALMFGAHEAVELAAEGNGEAADEQLARMQSLVQRVIADLRAAQASGHRLS